MNTINNGIPFVPENTTDPASGLNLSLNQIDALLQIRVQTVGANTPPAGVEGERHIVGTVPAGVWAGQANKLARYLNAAWSFYDARYAVAVDGSFYVRAVSTWAVVSGGGAVAWGDITGTLASQTDLQAALNAKEGTLVAGTNITIDRTNPAAPVISASGAGGSGVQVIPIACSDEATALTVGTAKVTFRMPYAFTLTGVRASLTTAQATGSIFTVDINESGISILSTKLTIDNTEKTSVTALAPPVISDSALANDSEITIDIDQIGGGLAAGLKVYLIGSPA
jgi:hypothetical protein